MPRKTLAVVGGGAASVFAAITAARNNPQLAITIYEASDKLLDKVKISGGGRCNVTHHCFDIAELVKNYPRGHKELKSVFSRFQPQDTIDWFEKEGVRLKAEPDGRMFPVTDSSQTIIDCLLHNLKKCNIDICYNHRIKSVIQEGPFVLTDSRGETLSADLLLLATGSSKDGYAIAESLGHSAIDCVPSLFTFKIKDQRIDLLSGVTFPMVTLTLKTARKKYEQSGPMLITHWGISGPAVLKLSAFAARELHQVHYKSELRINYVPGISQQSVKDKITGLKKTDAKKYLYSLPLFELPKRFWQQLLEYLQIQETTAIAQLSSKQIQLLTDELTNGKYMMSGKGIFKEEFVTCGGVSLKEVDLKTMQSKCCPNLYLAGELLDIDGITGGFNFQSAWSTGWIAGKSI